MLRDFIFEYSAYDIVLYLLKVAYFVLLTYFTGSTLGKKLLQIRVTSTEDRKPTFFEIVFRESVGKFLSGLVLYVGYFMIGADKQKRGLHDMLSDTYVVYHHQKTVAVPTPITYNTVPYPVQSPQMPPYQAGDGMGGQFVPQNQQPMPQNVSQMNQGGEAARSQQPVPQNAPQMKQSGMAQQNRSIEIPQAQPAEKMQNDVSKNESEEN